MERLRNGATQGTADFGRFVRLLVDRVSEDALTELLDDRVHDAKGEEAAEINNAGHEAQLEYLLEGMSEDRIRKELDAWLWECEED